MRLFKSSAEEYFDAAQADYPAPIRALFRVVVEVLYWYSRAMWRVDIEGIENLPARGEVPGSVIICNHTSMAEVVCIYSYLRRAGYPLRPIGKGEFFENRVIRWAFSRAGAIPVARGEADMSVMRRVKRCLMRGEHVFIFPEGTRVRSDEQKVEPKGGFALMASRAKAPIIPMAVCGFRDVTPEGKKLPRPVKCWVRISEPVHIEDAPADLKRSGRMEWVEKASCERMYAVRDDLRRAHPGRF